MRLSELVNLVSLHLGNAIELTLAILLLASLPGMLSLPIWSAISLDYAISASEEEP